MTIRLMFTMVAICSMVACSAPSYSRGLSQGVKTTARSAEKQTESNVSEKAAAGDAEAQHILGESYLFGRGVPINNVLAKKWLELSAGQGYAQGEYNLGWLYLTQQQEEKALYWLRSAASKGQPNAIKVLNKMGGDI